jgi:mannose-1-phosphate guanylyltransferase
MHAVVLVGGFGTRLRPLTITTPKPMLPVGHVPIIERLVGNLARGGVSDVTLALGFKPEPFLDAFPDGEIAGVSLTYAVEPEPLDTAGAIRFAAQASRIDDTFVVANGDILTDLDIGALVAFHRSREAQATLHLTAVDNPTAFGVVDLDEHGGVRRFVEKPAPGTEPSNLINAGTYVMEPSVLDLIQPGTKVSVERVVFPALVARGGVFALPTDNYWLDTGTVELYLRANLDVLAVEEIAAVHAESRVDAGAAVVRSVIGAGAQVAAGATVIDSVLLPGAIVEGDTVVERSVVMGFVAAGARVVDSVIGAGASVDAGESLHGVRRPDPVG